VEVRRVWLLVLAAICFATGEVKRRQPDEDDGWGGIVNAKWMFVNHALGTLCIVVVIVDVAIHL